MCSILEFWKKKKILGEMTTRKRASAVDHKNQESLNVICKIMRSSRGVKMESKNTFQGIELCNWLIRANYARDVEAAVDLSNQLMQSTHTFEPVNKDIQSLKYDNSLYVFAGEVVDEPARRERTSSRENQQKQRRSKSTGKIRSYAFKS